MKNALLLVSLLSISGIVSANPGCSACTQQAPACADKNCTVNHADTKKPVMPEDEAVKSVEVDQVVIQEEVKE